MKMITLFAIVNLMVLSSFAGELKKFSGKWGVKNCNSPDYNIDLEIKMINEGKDLEVFFVKKGEKAVKNFTTLSENFLKDNPHASGFMRTITQTERYQGKIITAAIHHQLTKNSNTTKMLGVNVTTMEVKDDGFLKYERKGYTVQVLSEAMAKAHKEWLDRVNNGSPLMGPSSIDLECIYTRVK